MKTKKEKPHILVDFTGFAGDHECVSLLDLGMAYRKAKVDLFYATHSSLQGIADYEENLLINLEELRKKLNDEDESWVAETDFLGNWSLIPKGIATSNEEQDNLVLSSPQHQWRQQCKNAADKNTKPQAEFRLMAQASVDFHIFSALWIAKVGHKYDEKLTDCAHGNRLRRKANGDVNPFSHGSFTPYLKPFRTWRDNGIAAMRQAMNDRKKIVAVTADVSSFYHELNPDFMLNEEFLNVISLELTRWEQKINRLFILALKNWANLTPLGKGLPVGLPASALVANMALIELDRKIQQEASPLYYGRYVDDIMLVMEDGFGFESSNAVWEWLFARSGNLLKWKDEKKKDKIAFVPDYLANSKIGFSNKKNKVFLIEGPSGATLIDSLSHQIHERASEWRALPNLPRSAVHVATALVAATQSDGEPADNLRKADVLTMRRSGFALKLRDFEAYERNLHPDAWKDHRQAFLQAFIQHVLALPIFFDLSIYLPRIIRLATACEDFELLSQIIKALNDLQETVKRDCILSIKSCTQNPSENDIFLMWGKRIDLVLKESIQIAFPPRLTKKGKVNWGKYVVEANLLSFECSIKTMQAEQARFFAHDLAHMPFRFISLPKELTTRRGIPSRKSIINFETSSDLVMPKISHGLSILAEQLRFKKKSKLSHAFLPHALLFATRPFGLAELYFLNPAPYSEEGAKEIPNIVFALRGFSVTDKMPRLGNHGGIVIPDGAGQEKINIALASWKTDSKSWAASVAKMPDPDLNRYQRLTHLLNSLQSHPKQARYLLMPELSLPAHWFMLIAGRLQRRGISLITGVEYLHHKKSVVRNQVWAALSHDGLGFPSMAVIRQDKQAPALHEEKELQRLAGLKLRPENPWKSPPIIQHGGFHFAILVCSELTNISYRSALRGKIDALFVPEWNQDTESFNSLVESAALDIHAYIIQCNDRQYGDSRIRTPYKDSWNRDIVRIKGGKNDYFVIGEIDVSALRAFQSSDRSPTGPFKPVPDGFKIAFQRKTLPTVIAHE